MLFYKLQGVYEADVPSGKTSSERQAFAGRIAVATTDYVGNNDNLFIFVSGISEGHITVGLITKYFVNPVTEVKKFIAHIDLPARDFTVDEVTLIKMEYLLNTANRNDFVDDNDEILEAFELDKITGRSGRNITYGENLTKSEVSLEEAQAVAKRFFMTETLTPELDRIYAGRKNRRASGHPVHYIVESDDRDTRREIYKTLLDALYMNCRLDSRRYAFLDFRPGENYSQMCYEVLYKVCRGGAIVVRYLAGDDSEEDARAGGERETIENICEMAHRFRNEVLTIICLPRECKKVKSIFFEHLGTMAFVEIKEDFIKSEDARAFLSALASEKHVRTDKKLFSAIEAERTYLAGELRNVFEEWYNGKLKTSIYPQYKDISVARKEVVKGKPRGSAYDDLDEMVGLTEAKQVIKKALNYYKMQKLYEEKGVKRDSPAMHMVFSGNPGTAKTTVARLFARIMRENGLLSKGQLVEVGRGDLVGKYVGWTAQTVQAKFKAAMGGVLFIDEAYSLVDDTRGSYGDEAINTIVQEMENHRADVVVILAGYPDKMEEFMHKNPGLRSRVAFHVPFADYDSEELCEIARLIGKKNGMSISREAFVKLEQVFERARVESDFGNGRYVRNVFEQAKMNQASRLLERDLDKMTAEDITTITADDIVIPQKNVSPQKRRIGF
ncbi:MAG: AAA family ATPase [Clostridia bacterium]|nr:AAA family ATPase [Clostridia bacterium]